MEKEEKDVQEVHETPENEVEDKDEKVVINDDETLSPEEIADLKKKADASSQNFERLKKIEEENKRLREQLQDNPSDDDDEEVEQLRTRLSEIEGKLNQRDVLDKYPVLSDVWSDFEEYTQAEENQGMRLETAAKAFIAEKELDTPKRKGLEKSSGGEKPHRAPGMTSEQLEKIRKEDGKKYREMLKKGQVVFK